MAVAIGRDALFPRRLRPYQSASPLLAALSRTPVTRGSRCSASARGALRPQTWCVTRVRGFQVIGEGRTLHRRGGLHACRSLYTRPSATPTGGGQGCDRRCSHAQSRMACCPYATNIGNKVALDLRLSRFKPTVSLGVTYAVVCTCGCDDGRIAPTRCALIAAGLDGR